MSTVESNAAVLLPGSLEKPKQRENTPICEICQKIESQYTCPRCGLRTCSVPCCRQHKIDSGCSGKRDATAYMSLSAMTDQTLMSDYHFLNGGSQQVDTSRRLWKAMEESTTSRGTRRNEKFAKRPRHASKEGDTGLLNNQVDESASHPILVAAEKSFSGFASSLSFRGKSSDWSQHGKISFTPHHVLRLAGVNLLNLPSMMERHRNNQSKFTATSPPIINWTVEIKYICPHCEATSHEKNMNCSEIRYSEHLSSTVPYSISSILLHSIPETVTLQVLHSRASDKLQAVCNSNDQALPPENSSFSDPVVWLMKQIPCPENSPVYIEKGSCVDGATLSDVLRNMTLIEYPTLYMIPQHHYKALQVHFPCPIRELVMD